MLRDHEGGDCGSWPLRAECTLAELRQCTAHCNIDFLVGNTNTLCLRALISAAKV